METNTYTLFLDQGIHPGGKFTDVSQLQMEKWMPESFDEVTWSSRLERVYSIKINHFSKSLVHFETFGRGQLATDAYERTPAFYINGLTTLQND